MNPELGLTLHTLLSHLALALWSVAESNVDRSVLVILNQADDSSLLSAGFGPVKP
jgi:hypothetical protein